MSGYRKDDYNYMANRRKSAFTEMAKQFGKDHPITKMMGSLAWGRNGAEQGPNGTLQTAIREYAYLEGYFSCLNLWARDHDRAAQQTMLDLWPRGMERAPW